MYFKKVLFTLTLSFGIFLTPALSNLLIDPFQFFHKPILRPVKFNKNQRYQMAGVIKNYNFDSIISGTSMSENFTALDLKNNLSWENPVKLTISGLLPKNIKFVLEYALNKKNISNIILDVHWYYIAEDPLEENSQNPFPSFLYNDSYKTIFKYLFNDGVFKESRNLLFKNYQNYTNSLDELGIWFNETLFEKYNSEENVNLLIEKLIKNKNKYNYNDILNLNEVYKSIDLNLIPLLENYSQTNFVLFLPPYSTFFYASDERIDWMKRLIYMRKFLIDKTKDLPNVTVYGFDDAFDIVNNIKNYKDYGHYRTSVNQYILESIRDGKHILNNDNIDQYLKKMIDNINSYQLN